MSDTAFRPSQFRFTMKRIIALWTSFLRRLTYRRPTNPTTAPTTVPSPGSPPPVAGAGTQTSPTPPVESADSPDAAYKQILRLDGAPQPPAPSLDAGHTREATLAKLAGLEQIPALKALADNFTSALSKPDIDVDEIVSVISKDSALCLSILRMANSVEIGSRQRVDNLETAVQMLGVSRVRRAAEAVKILRANESDKAVLDWCHLWIHSLGTAIIAEKLAERLRAPNQRQIYLAALFHDVGKIALSTLYPADYRNILIGTWLDGTRLEALERQCFGVEHSEIGAAFVTQNKMSLLISQTVSHHSAPENATAHRSEVAIVNIANFLAKFYGLGFSGSRLDETDGDLAGLTAWQVLMAETGRLNDAVQIQSSLEPFILSLRRDLTSLRQGL